MPSIVRVVIFWNRLIELNILESRTVTQDRLDSSPHIQSVCNLSSSTEAFLRRNLKLSPLQSRFNQSLNMPPDVVLINVGFSGGSGGLWASVAVVVDEFCFTSDSVAAKLVLAAVIHCVHEKTPPKHVYTFLPC